MKENYKKLLKKQIVNELTESEVYARLAELEKNEVNKKILKRISADEKSHAAIISRPAAASLPPALTSWQPL